VIKKLPKYENLLNTWFENNKSRPFSWGSFDCCFMMVDGLKYITNTDIGEDLRNTYYTPLGAYRVIQKNGGLLNILDHRIQNRHTNLNFLKRGDVVCIQNANTTLSAGICFGSYLCVSGENPEIDFKKPL
jgi:hypothetical protein